MSLTPKWSKGNLATSCASSAIPQRSTLGISTLRVVSLAYCVGDEFVVAACKLFTASFAGKNVTTLFGCAQSHVSRDLSIDFLLLISATTKVLFKVGILCPTSTS